MMSLAIYSVFSDGSPRSGNCCKTDFPPPLTTPLTVLLFIFLFVLIFFIAGGIPRWWDTPLVGYPANGFFASITPPKSKISINVPGKYFFVFYPSFLLFRLICHRQACLYIYRRSVARFLRMFQQFV